ncbi:hypothetical protein TSOC_003579 [Tetrabaena socialis]|uniref:Nudix hydrolase domain-containing protein n=1 Tax=Tetrabaena socialis TaxID=47790 RepID=A0A2J8AB68_9CHLO|nr:hypothetical protein TSOC_003579 [Tetrabaena socialis]|eukprot:PNH09770.1 hypothetical protein TSOC_003579 [Tetrabaena socialis]
MQALRGALRGPLRRCWGATSLGSLGSRGTSSSLDASAASTSGGNGPSRAYPKEPRVGVGVVVFRAQPLQGQDPEVLLVRRAKEPDRGMWCFPGGSLELGETLAACAAREVEEEAGLRLQGAAAPEVAGTHAVAGDVVVIGGGGGLLSRPTPFAAVDVLRRDADGAIRFHYAVIEVAAVCADSSLEPVPGDDADGAQWVRISTLRGMQDLTVKCDEMAEEAARRFAAPGGDGDTARE